MLALRRPVVPLCRGLVQSRARLQPRAAVMWRRTAVRGCAGGSGNEPDKGRVEPTREDLTRYRDQNDTWVDRYVPEAARPYLKLARVDRPIGTWLLLWPCLWSSGLAVEAGALPDLLLAAKFAAGAFIMRGAGCTINDMWDRDFDGRVARTRLRPLASGRVSMPQATAFLGAQLTAGLGILLSLNTYTIVLGASSLALVAAYPAMKRVTYWPQAFLGATLNWGALVGYAAVTGSLSLPVVLPLYAGSMCWTIVYDTIYAHQDADDDRALGLKSSALLLGDSTKPVLTGFAAAALAGWGTAGLAAGCAWPYFAALAGVGGHLAWQVGTADLSDRWNLTQRFTSNAKLGALMYAGVVGGMLAA